MDSKLSRLISIAAWVVATSLVLVAIYLAWETWTSRSRASAATTSPANIAQPSAKGDNTDSPSVMLPDFVAQNEVPAVSRQTSLHTIIPNRPGEEVRDYTVAQGDSVFEIASKFSIKPETLLWANYDLLNDNPDMISVDMPLKVPPVDGVLYQWKEGDTVDSVAESFEADPQAILSFPGNNIDLTNPVVQPGTWVMVPGGHREFRQWIIPVIPRGRAGVSRELYGAGACEGSFDGAYGTGGFIWPAGNHVISGNDYWSGHLGVDIGAGEGAPIYAADSGVVVFAGWANGGYGNMVMIDHGNGYQTLYAHMSQVVAGCGRSVSQGQTIGYSGSTGNSTGAHLHFEVRYEGGFVSPWYVLPAP
jgi:hypothetical protein